MNIKLRPASEWESGEPGIYSGVSDEAYFAGSEINNSFNKEFDHAPAFGLASLRKEDADEIEAFRVGRALHLRMSDSAGFSDRYVVAGQCAAITKDGKGDPCTSTGSTRVGGKWYCGTHIKKVAGEPDVVEYVKAEELRWFNEWVERMSDPTAYAVREIFDHEGEHEVAFRWFDEPTAFMCRGKFDFFSLSGWAADYKTCQDARESEFMREVNRRLYYRQQAFYEDGAAVLGVPIKEFRFIALEKPARRYQPALVAVHKIAPLAVEVGRQENRMILDRAAGCKLTGYWPGYDLSKPTLIGLPAWRGVDQNIAGAALAAVVQHDQEDYDDELPV